MSWCKRCSTIAQNERVKAGRAKNRYIKKQALARDCSICGKVYYSTIFKKKTCSPTCSNHLKNKNWRLFTNKKKGIKVVEEKKQGIAQKFLVRGNISIGNRESAISCQA